MSAVYGSGCSLQHQSLSPPAPPLPPPLPFAGDPKIMENAEKCHLLTQVRPFPICNLDYSTGSSFQCANSEDELIQVCDRLQLKESSGNIMLVSFYRHLKPILQDGPKCGLVALSMASSCTDHPQTVDELFSYARDCGYTNHGEMFSVDNMARLAMNTLHCETEILENGLEDEDYIIRQLVLGNLVLVPYDADFNHYPCCKRGHKAHWAVITGVVFLVENRTYQQLSQVPSIAVTETASHFHCCREAEVILEELKPFRMYLLARQGKSRHLSLWRYRELQESNRNLIELDPSRVSDGKSYIVPPGGVKEGLCGRAIILKGLTMQMP